MKLVRLNAQVARQCRKIPFDFPGFRPMADLLNEPFQDGIEHATLSRCGQFTAVEQENCVGEGSARHQRRHVVSAYADLSGFCVNKGGSPRFHEVSRE
jgi:hypothetical protein